MTTQLLSAEAISCERGYRQLFQHVNFELKAGEVLRIAGPNGCGKSTLLKVIAGISSDYQGNIFWKGIPVQETLEDFRCNMSFLGHNKAVKLALTVRENLAWFQSLYSCKSSASIDSALAEVGLSGYEDIICGQLSAGQQQRVALARLLMSSAQCWILDEPFTAIDKEGVKQFETIIAVFVEGGGSVIITTHHHLQLSIPISILELGNFHEN